MTCCRHAPWAEVLNQLHHLQAPVKKDHIDREPHEGGVHRRSRLQQQTFAGAQRRAPEQAPHASERPISDHCALARHGVAGHVHDGLRIWFHSLKSVGLCGFWHATNV
jgi:hypothetical protein